MTTSEMWGEEAARRYDAQAAAMFAPDVLERTVDFLAGLAGTGRALELAIGTGRVAVPLAARGVPVVGIELSEPMVAQLRTKVDEHAIPVVIGDMATATAPGTFTLVYLVFNTLSNLLTQDEQVACFRNVAAHLRPGGCFVIEVEVPQLQRLPPGETVRAFTVTPTHLGFDEIDVATQTAVSHHYGMARDRLERWSMPFRYVWPSELDLMAQLAGMTLRERWGSWTRAPFTSASTTHVSVWERA
jgi:SAM-dependent methyltransferase